MAEEELQDELPVLEVAPAEGIEKFSIPLEYADKGWTKTAPEFKTHDEYSQWITKQYDSQQEYLGGKLEKFATEKGYFKTPDWEKEEEVTAFLSKLPPEDVTKYPTNEFQDEGAKEYFNNAFKEAGLAVPQAKKMLEAFNIYQEQILTQATNKADYITKMSEIFGNDFEKSKEPIDNMLKRLLNPEEMSLVNDKMPNNLVAIMYKISKGLADKYGHKEQPVGGTSPNANTVVSKEDKATKHQEYTKELQELSQRPHTMEEKQAIINKMVDLYK